MLSARPRNASRAECGVVSAIFFKYVASIAVMCSSGMSVLTEMQLFGADSGPGTPSHIYATVYGICGPVWAKIGFSDHGECLQAGAFESGT